MFGEKLTLTALLSGMVAPVFAAVDIYEIEPNHTYPSIEFPHMGISVWRGKFDRTSGRITIDRGAGTGTADVVIDMASINFGLDRMDEAARSDDWFNVAKFPTAAYKGTLRFTGDVPGAVEGQFTLMGVTRPLNLTINSFKCIPHPKFKKEVCGADAEGNLNWSEYGMKHSKYGEGDAGRVHLRIQVEALKQD
ncbi:MAG: YceI family protein [Betaproteobacteria bacterium]